MPTGTLIMTQSSARGVIPYIPREKPLEDHCPLHMCSGHKRQSCAPLGQSVVKMFPMEISKDTQSVPREDSDGSHRDFSGANLMVCLSKILRKTSESFHVKHFHHTTLRLDPHFGRVTVKPYKQSMWFGLVWWQLLIGHSWQFPVWHKSWVNPQELCGINSGSARGRLRVFADPPMGTVLPPTT